MTPSRNRLFLACAIALVFGIPTFAQHKTETYQFAGTYHAGFQFGGSSITLGSDGTFRNDSGSCTFTTQESGKYVFSNGVLRFTIKTGDVLTILNHEESDAIVVDGSNVRYRNQVMSYNEWGQKVTGWVALNIYKWGVLNGKTLDELRS